MSVLPPRPRSCPFRSLTELVCTDPLKGGKMGNCKIALLSRFVALPLANHESITIAGEGGIRVNSWASGGFLPAKVRGTKYEGLACGWDWCKLSLFPPLPSAHHCHSLAAAWATTDGTFTDLAGIEMTDWRAAAADLPPVDSHSLAPVLLGTGQSSRREIPIGTEPRSASTINRTELCKVLRSV